MKFIICEHEIIINLAIIVSLRLVQLLSLLFELPTGFAFQRLLFDIEFFLLFQAIFGFFAIEDSFNAT